MTLSPPLLTTNPPSAGLAIPAVPAGFLRLPERVLQWIDSKLGYFGRNRDVFFYYEPRGQEVIWNDGKTYGFGCGGWMAFGQEVTPVARSHGADLGEWDRPGRHALVLDRALREAYLAARDAAEAFVTGQFVAGEVEEVQVVHVPIRQAS